MARVSKADSSGSNTYLRASSGLIGSIVADSGATYTPGVSEKRGATSTFYHSDIKNSVEQTSTSQTVTASKQYDAFGNEVSSSGSWHGPFQYGGAFGYHTDSDYGLKHLGARYYDPTTGRFLSRDPIKDGRNWYGYCGGNPLTRADANGHAWDVVADFAGIGYDIYELVTEPSLANAGWLLADLFLLLVPFVPSRGALKLGDTFLGAVLPRLGKAGHEAVDAAELLARNYKKGKAAEELVEGVQNTSPVRAPMTGRNRIPDRFEEGKLVGEIKNVDKLYKTAQMSDLLDIAKANNVPLTLWTDTRTELSKSLQDLINRGEIIHFRRPFPNRFQGGMW